MKLWHAITLWAVLCLTAIGVGVGIAVLVEGTANADNPPPIGQVPIYQPHRVTDSWCISPSLRLVNDMYNGMWTMRTDGMPLDDPYECSHYFEPR